MLAEQRRHEILREVRSRASLQTSQLAARFGVSEMTIRRDLDALAARGLVRRVRGGALGGSPTRHEPSFAEAGGDRRDEKDLIGRRAASLVGPGDTVLIDIGTTGLALARHLRGRAGLTVVTNNLAVYDELADDEAIDLVLLGGLVRRNYRSLVGFLTEDALAGIRADVAFLGISGIAADGALLDTTVEEIGVKRAMAAAAMRVVLLADGAKFFGSGLGRVAEVDVVDAVVTSPDAPAERLELLRERGIEVVVAGGDDRAADAGRDGSVVS